MSNANSNTTKRNLALLLGCVVVWLILDRITKVYFDTTYALGQSAPFSIPGLISFDLVHNTGAAWGVFSGNPQLLGIFSVIVCTAIIVYALYSLTNSKPYEVVALALIFAGGVGNVIDRFMYGYVVDFISPTFIDFPTFNVADIGVTVGVFLFVCGLFIQIAQATKQNNDEQTRS